MEMTLIPKSFSRGRTRAREVLPPPPPPPRARPALGRPWEPTVREPGVTPNSRDLPPLRMSSRDLNKQ